MFAEANILILFYQLKLVLGFSNSASISPDGNWNEDDKDAYAPRECLPDGRGIRRVEQQATYCVDDERDGLMVGESPQPVGHALCWHKRATGEGQREEPDEPC